MKKTLTILLILFEFMVILTGCFSSTRIYKKQYEKNDSTFVQRDVGAEILIGLNNGKEYTGELLSVSDSIIILSKEYGLSEEELLSSSSNISIIQNQEIKSIWVLGKSNHLIGLAIGLGVGALLIKTAEDVNKSEWNQAYTGLLCIPAGFLIGAATSTYDEEIYNYKNSEDFDFMQLNIYSRYGGKEPKYLRETKR